jgi:hypothetical protein
MTPGSEAYHIHIDGPVLPSALHRYAVEELGFYEDDFAHSMTLETESVARPARQLTRVFRSRADRDKARQTYLRAHDKAIETGFKGFIQMEFIMSQTDFNPARSQKLEQSPISIPRFPLSFKSDQDSSQRNFKKHELHLELKKQGIPSFMLDELVSSGFSPSEGNDITFTASGDPDPIRRIWRELLSYLGKLEEAGLASFEGRLTTEATVAHQLFGVPLSSTPAVVEALGLK